jgi:hypothetical protein
VPHCAAEAKRIAVGWPPVVGLADFLSAQPRHARTGVSGETSATTAHLRPALEVQPRLPRLRCRLAPPPRTARHERQRLGFCLAQRRPRQNGDLRIGSCQSRLLFPLPVPPRQRNLSPRCESTRCRLSPQPCSAPARHADPTASIEVEESLVEGDNRSEFIAAETAPMAAARPQPALL